MSVPLIGARNFESQAVGLTFDAVWDRFVVEERLPCKEIRHNLAVEIE